MHNNTQSVCMGSTKMLCVVGIMHNQTQSSRGKWVVKQKKKKKNWKKKE